MRNPVLNLTALRARAADDPEVQREKAELEEVRAQVLGVLREVTPRRKSKRRKKR